MMHTDKKKQVFCHSKDKNFETVQALLCAYMSLCESVKHIKYLFGYVRVFSFSF